MPRGRGPGAKAVSPEAPLAAVLAAVGGLYVAESVVTGVPLVALPTILRESGLPLERIGLVDLALLPWVLKGLGAGAVERYRLPPAGRPRTPRIVALGTLISALSLAAAAVIGPAAFGPLLACLLVAALATATVDIARDGFAVETLSARNRGWGNAAQFGGAYLGLSVGGAAVRRLGSAASVRIGIAAQGLTLVLLPLAANSGLRVPDLLGALALLAVATAAFSFVALYAELMAYASPAQAGIDFTLFPCADALIALLGGAVSGVLADQLAYPTCFALAAESAEERTTGRGPIVGALP